MRASRPGESIMLSPGWHAIGSTVWVQHPLRLVGTASTPHGTTIAGTRGLDPVLAFSSPSARLENLRVRSDQVREQSRLPPPGCGFRLPDLGLPL